MFFSKICMISGLIFIRDDIINFGKYIIFSGGSWASKNSRRSVEYNFSQFKT